MSKIERLCLATFALALISSSAIASSPLPHGEIGVECGPIVTDGGQGGFEGATWAYIGGPLITTRDYRSPISMYLGPSMSAGVIDKNFSSSISMDVKITPTDPVYKNTAGTFQDYKYMNVFLGGSTGYGRLNYGDASGAGHYYGIKAGITLYDKINYLIEVGRDLYDIDGKQIINKISIGVFNRW